MIELKRSRCAILPLVLDGKWYDLIDQGAKQEEYRTSKNVMRMIQRWWGESKIEGKVPVVEFRRGYAKDAPRMTWHIWSVWHRMAGGYNDAKMGEPDMTRYALTLGQRVTLTEGGK